MRAQPCQFLTYAIVIMRFFLPSTFHQQKHLKTHPKGRMQCCHLTTFHGMGRRGAERQAAPHIITLGLMVPRSALLGSWTEGTTLPSVTSTPLPLSAGE